MYQIEQQYLEELAFEINHMPRRLFDLKTAYKIDLNKKKRDDCLFLAISG